MKILVTGAAGFIGMHLSKRLLDEGHEVYGVDNLDDYYSTELKRARLREIAHENFTCMYGDITDADQMNMMFHQHKFEIVYHLAGQAGIRHSEEYPEKFTTANILGFSIILDLCRKYEVQQLFLASSSSVYGSGEKDMAFKEDQNTDFPLSYYAATKKSCEVMAASYSRTYGMKITAMRLFTVYGPWGRPDMATWKFTDAILNDQPLTIYGPPLFFMQTPLSRDFTYVGDVVEQMVRLIPAREDSEDPFQIYNIGTSSPVKVRDYVSLLETIIGKPAILEFKPLGYGEARRTHADMTKYKNDIFDHTPSDLKEGLTNFVNWFKLHNKDSIYSLPKT